MGSVTAQPHSHSVESTRKTNVNNNIIINNTIITINTATRPHTPHETTSTMRENKSRHLTVTVPSTYNVFGGAQGGECMLGWDLLYDLTLIYSFPEVQIRKETVISLQQCYANDNFHCKVAKLNFFHKSNFPYSGFCSSWWQVLHRF